MYTQTECHVVVALGHVMLYLSFCCISLKGSVLQAEKEMDDIFPMIQKTVISHCKVKIKPKIFVT